MIQKPKKYFAISIFILLSIIWSSTWVTIKIGLETVPPFYSAGIRFFLAFIFISLFAIFKGHSFPKKLIDHLFFIGFGLINYLVGYASVYWENNILARD